jgi:hypothetical protein
VTRVFAWNPDEAEAYRDADAEVLVWRPAPRRLVTRIHGAITVACLHHYMTCAEREMGRGPLRVFHDWTEMASYEPAARDELKRWGKLHNPDFDGVHYLVRSKVVAMLISVAALTLGRDLHATTDRPRFLELLELALHTR